MKIYKTFFMNFHDFLNGINFADVGVTQTNLLSMLMKM